ncbi:conjugative transfer system coupling protein TraD [Hydrocarboniclastica marina]|uniref:DUF87 domain-containing protein n=1 Tax=Hydrocarboniclastica marina TaxID=2259620 RepID=A0A4P7XLY3_9ALTE|nr:conjugative transfer system coupling protein TraD [Hydrocarboniclastica marina]QCF28148.1 DUF87 domain-containing protein [Hydrocarboniclastica marina]
MIWRPNYEAQACVGWIAAAAAGLAVNAMSSLPPEPFYFMAGISGLMASARLPAAIRLATRHRGLTGSALNFTELADVAKMVQGKADQLWLGDGFDWENKHAQRAFELTKRDWSELQKGSADMGVKWLHGLETNESQIFQPMKHVEGHTLITGTTGSGKTRLFDLLITQRILTNEETIIVIDPKGDKELKENMRRACEFMGEPDRFIAFHPGFPEESIRLDPMANFSRPTELASRIAALIGTSSGGEVFKDFGQMALNNIIQGLLLVDSRPSLVRLRRYLEGGTEGLVIQAVQKYIEKNIPELIEPHAEAMSKVANANGRNKKAIAALRFYREVVQIKKPNSDLEGLLTMFEHDKAHFSKMIASLLPLMNMLTSGDIGPMLSPDRTDQDDIRPIYDTRKIIEKRKVAYIGLDSLTDSMVGSAIGSMVLADLAAVAGDRYNYGEDLKPVNIFVDECAEVINDPLIQILNKGRGAKLRLFVATQTIADFSARLGNKDKAMQVLGNINNSISLRVIDSETQEYITNNLPMTRIKYVMRTQGMSSHGEDPALFGGNHGERLMEEEAPLIAPQLLGMLPNLEYLAKISGGRIVKGRLPILVENKKAAA